MLTSAVDRHIASHAGVTPTTPFLKWAGGKTSLLPELEKHVPARFGDYYEPFLGGAALFFHLNVQGKLRKSILGDTNPSLIVTYRAVRDNVEGVIDVLGEMVAVYRSRRGGSAYYYSQRNWFNKRVGDEAERAARFIFLNKTCFNGLYRVNLDGHFNVPAGKFKSKPTVLDEAGLKRCSEVLRGVSIQCHDFRVTTRDAARGDFVYLDCPYWPASGTADFTAYTKAPFGPAQQEMLRDEAMRLKKRGVKVLLSNSDVPQVRKLYRGFGFDMRRVTARRNINSHAGKRGPVGELLIW